MPTTSFRDMNLIVDLSAREAGEEMKDMPALMGVTSDPTSFDFAFTGVEGDALPYAAVFVTTHVRAAGGNKSMI